VDVPFFASGPNAQAINAQIIDKHLANPVRIAGVWE
jgi:hypothetical protein